MCIVNHWITNMANLVTRYEDSKGRLWKSLEEATSADAGYALDAKLQAEFNEFRRNLAEYTGLRDETLTRVANYLRKNYSWVKRK